MPCYDSRDHYTYEQGQEERDRLTALLCAACRLLDEASWTKARWPEELRQWWKAHKQWDEERDSEAS